MKSFENEKENFSAVQTDFTQQILRIIRGGKSPKITWEKLSDYHANDISKALPLLSKEERARVYRLIPADEMAEILDYADNFADYIEEIDIKKAASILEEMDTDSAAEFLRQTSKEKRQILLELMDDEGKKSIAVISSFSEDEIGSHMTMNYVTIKSNLSVRRAMHSLIAQAAENDNISTLYVLDENDVFYGAIPLNDLIIAREDTDLESLIVTSYPYVYATRLIEDCVDELRDYYEDTIPVLSDKNHILGVITAESIADVFDEGMRQDYAQLGGLTRAEDLEEPIIQSMKKRLPWLIILLFLGLVVSGVVGVFESVIARLPIVICFQSLILDMAGNVGTQSLAVTIRVLTDENLTFKQKLTLTIKEMKTGFFNGILLGTIAFFGIGVYIMMFKGKSMMYAFAVSACIGVSLLLAIVISSITGTTIPMLFKKIGVDPAVASGPLITTINDLVAVITYYGLSWWLLIGVMGLV